MLIDFMDLHVAQTAPVLLATFVSFTTVWEKVHRILDIGESRSEVAVGILSVLDL
jgi:hypothetical protein